MKDSEIIASLEREAERLLQLHGRLESFNISQSVAKMYNDVAKMYNDTVETVKATHQALAKLARLIRERGGTAVGAIERQQRLDCANAICTFCYLSTKPNSGIEGAIMSVDGEYVHDIRLPSKAEYRVPCSAGPIYRLR